MRGSRSEGSLFLNARGRPLTRVGAWQIVKRLVRAAGSESYWKSGQRLTDRGFAFGDAGFERLRQRRIATVLSYANADDACDAAFVGFAPLWDGGSTNPVAGDATAGPEGAPRRVAAIVTRPSRSRGSTTRMVPGVKR